MNKKSKNSKLLKVIYYDENAAMDYVTIMNDGNITSEEINKVIEGSNKDIKVAADASAKSSLMRILNLSIGVSSKIGGHNNKEKIINSTITMNIMTEFVKLAETDDNIEKLYDLKLEIDENTFTFIKAVYPYIKLFNDTEMIDGLDNININKIDEVILSTKGYFEFIATKNQQEEAILRFNIDCLRNNYKFNDLLIMDLCYYGIRVGNATRKSIRAENELNKKEEILTKEELFDESSKNSYEEKLLPIYDIIIAGVKND